MKALALVLVLLLTSVASAQWGYVPIEQSRSYRSIGRYSGPVYPYYGPSYYGPQVRRFEVQRIGNGYYGRVYGW